MKEKNLEFYKQFYENTRFYYKLESSLLISGLVIGLAVLTIRVTEETQTPEWWQCYICGWIWALLSITMQRIARIRLLNRDKLIYYACELGDKDTEEIQYQSGQLLIYIRIALICFGIILKIIGIILSDFESFIKILLFIIALFKIPIFSYGNIKEYHSKYFHPYPK